MSIHPSDYNKAGLFQIKKKVNSNFGSLLESRGPNRSQKSHSSQQNDNLSNYSNKNIDSRKNYFHKNISKDQYFENNIQSASTVANASKNKFDIY